MKNSFQMLITILAATFFVASAAQAQITYESANIKTMTDDTGFALGSSIDTLLSSGGIHEVLEKQDIKELGEEKRSFCQLLEGPGNAKCRIDATLEVRLEEGIITLAVNTVDNGRYGVSLAGEFRNALLSSIESTMIDTRTDREAQVNPDKLNGTHLTCEAFRNRNNTKHRCFISQGDIK